MRMTRPCLKRSTKRLMPLLGLLALLTPFSGRADPAPGAPLRLAVEDYRERVYAAWLGQVIGNIYGLSYEFRFIDEAGPDRFPYGYGEALERARAVDGAFSDDDTDIEYMYLLQMERHGIEPTYAQLAAAWKHHVRDRVWVANRSALTLMHAGYGPPVTGSRDYNPNWFQIDPQLVNELWAVTAPGMVDYAVAKSAWAARITSDGFGIEPTMHYAAMYAAAFFTADIEKLVDIGTAALPAGSRFARTVEHMKRLHRRYPDDWRKARHEMAGAYFREFDYNRGAWTVVDANLNGAAGILALLYGQGDFQRTLDLACAMGFDADNQAATLSGLLGIVHGIDGIPHDLLYPLGKARWPLPFNDRYVNVSRHDLPDASIRDIARRTARQGERVILAGGGSIAEQNGKTVYAINEMARFEPPFELVRFPTILAERDRPLDLRFDYREAAPGSDYRLGGGALPDGLELGRGRIHGVPVEPGRFEALVQVRSGADSGEVALHFRVFDRNLAPEAAEILVNDSTTGDDIGLIRDGVRRGATYYNRAADSGPRVNHYGYRWDTPQRIETLVFNPGLPEEWGGWFTSLEVQFDDGHGRWVTANLLAVEPPLDLENTQWLKGAYIDHALSIEPVHTTAIRIIGNAGGVREDERNGGGLRHYTAIGELAVYPDRAAGQRTIAPRSNPRQNDSD
jgi:hypothetical protein